VIALTRAISSRIADCELTHLDRVPIDVDRARAEHAEYERTLAALGCDVRRVPAADDLPDSVFIEDTAVVLDELAVITRPGAASRRSEVLGVANVLAQYRPIATITAPATLDGGDVLHVGRTLYVGIGNRTNATGVDQLRHAVREHGYEVRAIPFAGCLHLKTAVTLVGDGQLLVNPSWVDASAFNGLRALAIDSREPFAANALLISGRVVHGDQFSGTRRILERAGCTVVPVPAGELAKAEGGVTCCSVLLA
jgi:dimethylargininase